MDQGTAAVIGAIFGFVGGGLTGWVTVGLSVSVARFTRRMQISAKLDECCDGLKDARKALSNAAQDLSWALDHRNPTPDIAAAYRNGCDALHDYQEAVKKALRNADADLFSKRQVVSFLLPDIRAFKEYAIRTHQLLHHFSDQQGLQAPAPIDLEVPADFESRFPPPTTTLRLTDGRK